VRMTGAVALRGIRAAARVICDSEVIRQEILRRGLVEPDRLSVVPLGVEDVFAPDGPADLPREAEARLVRVGAGPVILHVGGMVTRKRLDLVMRAVAFARRELPGAVLVRVGGPLSSAMRTLARQLGIEMAIVEMPFLTRPELAAMYRRADVLLLCSETEGFGLPVLEAMASGLSVVARNLPAVREVAGEAVQFVDGQDPQAFAAAVVAVLRDAPVREAMRRRGLERAAMFRWGRTVERTARVYQDVLRQTSEAAGR
jgi:glycosyltransferase involved in cell wall biosynthesis